MQSKKNANSVLAFHNRILLWSFSAFVFKGAQAVDASEQEEPEPEPAVVAEEDEAAEAVAAS